MATLNIQGRKVKVDDAFLSMTPDQQNAAVEEIAKSLPAKTSVDPATNQPPGVPAYAPPGVDGYDQKTGEVAALQTSLLDKVGAFSTGGLQGVPVVGPYLDKASSAAAAAMAMPFTGKSFDELYNRGNQYSADVRRDNPHTATAGGVTGAVAGTVPAMVAAPAAFGIGVESIPLRLGASTVSGGLLNGTDAAVRSGGDPEATAWGAGIGAGLGFVAPAVAPLVGKGVKWAADGWNLRGAAKELGVDKVAAALMAKAFGADALDAGTKADLAKLGPSGMLMDLGENLRSQAAGLAALPGEGKTIVKGAINARDADANWRIRSGLNEALGEAPTPSNIIDRASQNQQRLAPEYREALRDAGPVDTLPIARYLETEAQTLRGEPQRAVQRVRAMLDHQPTPADIARARANGEPPPGTSLVTDAAELLNTRHAIDDMLETTQGTNAGNALQTARQAVDDELRASVPGIKEVDAKYAELARQKEAVQRGQTVLSSGREAPRPDELAAEVRRGALPQGMQIGPSAVPLRLREGARAEIERIVGTKANDRVALQEIIKGEGDWNRARLSTLWGKEKTDHVLDLLDRERAFAETTNQVTRNSYTAARQAAQKDLTGAGGDGFGIPQAYMAGGLPGVVRATGVKGVNAVVDALRGLKTEASRADIARTLTSNNSAVIDALLKANAGSRLPTSQIDDVARAVLLTSGQRR
ncbi:MAG: hypothetical protein E5V48_02580 [Mesorhizobium sp.]|nr:MAG: hypothetical protein E5V48_02580 [Mesorhizobium sp.]